MSFLPIWKDHEIFNDRSFLLFLKPKHRKKAISTIYTTFTKPVVSSIMDSDELRVAQIQTDLHLNINTQISRIAGGSSDVNTASLLKDLHQFQPCPQLLDNHLDHYIDSLLKSYFEYTNSASMICEAFYTFGKIVGVKRLLSYMKTEISLIPLIIGKLKCDEKLHWQEEYLLICCLIVLALTPFDLNSFGPDTKTAIYEVGTSNVKLLNSGPLQALGSRLIGSVIMRSDCHELMDRFVDELISSYQEFSEVAKCGYLQSLNIALQKDQTELKLIDNVKRIYELLKTIQDEDGDLKLEYLLKIYCKMIKYFDELDEFDAIDDIIGFFDQKFAHKSTTIRSVVSRNFTKLATKVDDCTGIDIMIDAVYTTKEMLVEKSMETIDANRLHTYLLFIAELLYKDLIDQGSINDINTILSHSLFFQQSQITYVSGANIRDSSNYIIWALARSPSLKIEPGVFLDTFTNLLFCCCFDKELMIRRSSTAALQELIGRHGSKNWDVLYPRDRGTLNSSKNVDILQALDFIELGSTQNSFINIPSKILKIFPELTPKFVTFLSRNILNNLDHEIVKISGQALRVILGKDVGQSLVESQVSLFVEHLAKKPHNSFIGLAETLPLCQLLSLNHQSPIYSTFNSQNIDHHKASPFVIEAYLQITYTLIRHNPDPTDLNWDIFYPNLFSLIRVESPSILEYLKQICPLLSLPQSHTQRWLYYIRNNNINTSSCVTYLSNFHLFVDDVVEFLKDDNGINAFVKTEILQSISSYLKRGNKLNDQVLGKLVKKLDDYTISEQGDVGSKIRTSMISLIAENLVIFESNTFLRQEVLSKLLRLSAEPIDSIRVSSIELLLQMTSEEQQLSESFHTRSSQEFFNNLLTFFQRHFLQDKSFSISFWTGYIFTAGAIRSTNDLITSSLRAFLLFYSNQPQESQIETLLHIASIIKPQNLPPDVGSTSRNRANKTALVGLQFLARILQLNCPIPECFNTHGLFIRVFNLHLNTTNLTRICNVIKIFGQLYISKKHVDSLKRLCWLCCNHQLAKVRVNAAEELFSIYKELGTDQYHDALKVLGETDWSAKDRKTLKPFQEVIFVC